MMNLNRMRTPQGIEETVQRRAVQLASHALLRRGPVRERSLEGLHAELRQDAPWHGELFPRSALELGHVLRAMTAGEGPDWGIRVEPGSILNGHHWALLPA